MDFINGKKVALSVEEGIQIWKDIATKFEQSHDGFRVNFLLCAVKRLGKSKLYKDLKEFVDIFNSE